MLYTWPIVVHCGSGIHAKKKKKSLEYNKQHMIFIISGVGVWERFINKNTLTELYNMT